MATRNGVVLFAANFVTHSGIVSTESGIVINLN